MPSAGNAGASQGVRDFATARRKDEGLCVGYMQRPPARRWTGCVCERVVKRQRMKSRDGGGNGGGRV